MVEFGVFLPVINNGWIVSTAAPQYQPSYAMNKAMTLLAEDLGFSFVLSPAAWLTHLDSCIVHAASWNSKAKRVWQAC